MFQNTVQEAAYKRARGFGLSHEEAWAESQLARPIAAPPMTEPPLPPRDALAERNYEGRQALSVQALDIGLATQQHRNDRASQLRTEIAALERDMAERPDPRVARRAALVAELNRL